jgi:hypothetical protein
MGKRSTASAAVVLALLGIVIAGATWWGTAPSAEIPVPPTSASPEQFVRSYLAAANAHDVDTMNALTEGGQAGGASRFRPTWTMRDVHISPATPDPWIGDSNTTYTDLVHVDVDLHIIRGHDLNFPDDSDTYWGYILARRSPTSPWRIVDQGVA